MQVRRYNAGTRGPESSRVQPSHPRHVEESFVLLHTPRPPWRTKYSNRSRGGSGRAAETRSSCARAARPFRGCTRRSKGDTARGLCIRTCGATAAADGGERGARGVRVLLHLLPAGPVPSPARTCRRRVPAGSAGRPPSRAALRDRRAPGWGPRRTPPPHPHHRSPLTS